MNRRAQIGAKMPRWTLKQEDEVLGTLEESNLDMFVVQCTFLRTPAFERLRPVFERKLAVAAGLTVTDEKLIEEFDALERATCPPALQLLDKEGVPIEFGILHIDGSQAGFRR
jgi:hypothetical protein